MESSSKHPAVSPIVDVLHESLFKLELLKLICNSDHEILSVLLGDQTKSLTNLEMISSMNEFMDEYWSILSNPDLEWTTNTASLLDETKQNTIMQFHKIYIECMKNNNKTSLNINEIISLNRDNATNNKNEDKNTKNHNEKWESITNSFIKYLNLSTNTFNELSKQFNASNKAETAKETINKLISEYKTNKHEFDEIESVLNKDREYRANVRNDMSFNINKLQNDIDILRNQYETQEKELSEHEENTTKSQITNHDKHVKNLNSDIEKTTSKLIEVKAMNHNLELDIKKKVKRIEHEIEEIKAKYNKDMIEISKESDKLLKLNQAETGALNELEIKIKELEKERAAHEKLMEEQKQKEAALKRMCEDAAIKIQKLWRGHKVRKSMKKDKKKDKGKKKK